jgi:hypothetical protein
MVSLADLLSVESEVELDGKTYKLRPPNLLEQGKFQRWLEQRARESIDRATYLDDSSRLRQQNLISTDIAAGEYEWGSMVCVKALQTPTGVAKLLEIILAIPAEESKKLVDEHLSRIVAVISAAVSDDPKAVRAALKTLGLPADFLTPRRGSSSDSAGRRSTSRKKKSKR